MFISPEAWKHMTEERLKIIKEFENGLSPGVFALVEIQEGGYLVMSAHKDDISDDVRDIGRIIEKLSGTVTITSSLAVIGYNPENADMSNPKGENSVVIWCFMLTDAKGNRWKHEYFYNSFEEISAAKIPNLGDAKWFETYPEYGSAAYCEEEKYNSGVQGEQNQH